ARHNYFQRSSVLVSAPTSGMPSRGAAQSLHKCCRSKIGESTMKLVNTKLLTSVATMLTLGLVCFERSALPQSPCKEAKGNVVEVTTAGSPLASGTVSNAGWLNGTTLAVFPPGGNSTPWPTAFTFTSQFTLTTAQGQLKTNNLYVFDVV